MLTLPVDTLFAFLAYAFVASVTPGPNNVMLTASGANFGFRRTVPHILGVQFGFGFMVAVIGLGLGAIFQAEPRLQTALKLIGGAYLLWLAWKIASAGAPEGKAGGARPLTALEAALFQWLNVKGWVMAVGAVSVYASSGEPGLVLLLAGLFIAIGGVSSTLWAAFGVAIGGLLSSPARLRAFNVTMGLLLAASIVPMVL